MRAAALTALIALLLARGHMDARHALTEGATVRLHFSAQDPKTGRVLGHVCSGTHVGGGRALTAAHCLGALLRTSDGLTATVAWRDEPADLMLVAVRGLAHRPAARPDCRPLHTLEPVEVVGHPGDSGPVVRTWGLPAGPATANIRPWRLGQFVTAPSGGGSSGGGVFDLAGALRAVLVGGVGSLSVVVPVGPHCARLP